MYIGRLIFGLGTGLLVVASCRLIEETVPERMVSLILPIFFVGAGSSKMLANVVGMGIPYPDDIPGLQSSQ